MHYQAQKPSICNADEEPPFHAIEQLYIYSFREENNLINPLRKSWIHTMGSSEETFYSLAYIIKGSTAPLLILTFYFPYPNCFYQSGSPISRCFCEELHMPVKHHFSNQFLVGSLSPCTSPWLISWENCASCLVCLMLPSLQAGKNWKPCPLPSKPTKATMQYDHWEANITKLTKQYDRTLTSLSQLVRRVMDRSNTVCTTSPQVNPNHSP